MEHIALWWLVAGAVMVAMEAFAIAGVGLLFAGFGALSVALIIESDIVDETSIIAQIAWWCAMTVVWAALLWRPLKHFYHRAPKQEYKNMVGSFATVGKGGLVANQEGEVRWSGTIMRARLAKDAHVTALSEGAEVVVVDVQGVTLIVKAA